MKECIYCKCDLDDRNIIDFCQRCGVGAFGEKMFAAIIQNMKEASGIMVFSKALNSLIKW